MQEVFLQLPVVAPDAITHIRFDGQSLFWVHVVLQPGTGVAVGVAIGVDVGVGVTLPVGVGVGVTFPVGVGVGVEPRVNDNEQLFVVLFPPAFGRLAGALGETEVCLN